MKRKIIPYNTNLKHFARKLRNDSTLGEVILWKELNNKQFYGHDFHRQKPLLKYIVDLYCYELDLVIEIDGLYHFDEEKSQSDLIRDKELGAYGLTVIRFTEQEVKHDITNVLRQLEEYYLTHIEKHTPNPSQEGN